MTDNLHLQLDPGEVVLDGEAELQRVIASVGTDGSLRIHREHWSLLDSAYPNGCWHHDHDWGCALGVEATRRLVELLGLHSDLIATTEQLDVYRTRCQQLADRVQELEDLLSAADRSVVALDDRVGELTDSLRALIARVRRTGGYASPEEQDVLREAERVVGGELA